MYRFDRMVPRKKKRYAFLRFMFKFLIFALVVFGIWLYLRRPHVAVDDAGAKLVPTNFEEPATIHVTEPLYEMDLPADWKEISRKDYPYHVVTWKGTTKESAARTIDVYVDALPSNLAVNRVLPVSGEEDRLAVNEPSENCITFSPETRKLLPTEAAKLKPLEVSWQDIKFICDIPNSLRNVIATGSREGINKVTITGPTKGKHSYLIAYTDSSAHPEDKTFPAILRSFRAR